MVEPRFSLAGRVAVITGAGSGIGRAIARAYASAGAVAWIFDVDDAGAEQTVSLIAESGGRSYAAHCDVTSDQSVHQAVEQMIVSDQKIDILVNNAGVGFVGNILQTREADFDRLLSVNVKGMFHVTQAVLPHMIRYKKGFVLNIASIASLIAVKDRFAYCATKGAVLMMTKALALDHLADGIRSNCICPSRIHTPFVDDYLQKNYPGREAEMFAQLSAYQPLGRMGTPEEVASLALYLASDEASFHTGDVFPLSGGALMA